MTQDISSPSTERTSVLLERLLSELPKEGDVSIGMIVFRLRRRSFGGMFIFLAALSLIPGISFFAGIAMLVPAMSLSGRRTYKADATEYQRLT